MAPWIWGAVIVLLRNAGGGQSQTYGIGAQLGIAYNMGDFVYAGLTYQSPVSMTYKRVFDSNAVMDNLKTSSLLSLKSLPLVLV
jgi:long-subunit fatty acid transport protein